MALDRAAAIVPIGWVDDRSDERTGLLVALGVSAVADTTFAFVSSFGFRNLLWLPESVLAPMVGGYLMTQVGMATVFYLGGAAALSGALTMLAVLARRHGRGCSRRGERPSPQRRSSAAIVFRRTSEVPS